MRQAPERLPDSYKLSLRFATSPLEADGQQGEVLARYAVKYLGTRRVVIIDDRTAYGAGLANDFESHARSLGATVVGREFVKDHQSDFTVPLTRLRDLRPDVVFFGGMDNVAAPLAVQMRRLWPKAALLSGDGVCSPQFIALAGRESENMHCAQAGEAVERLNGGQRFLDRYKERFKGDVQVYAPYTYDAVHVIAAALKRAGSTHSEDLIKALRATDYVGLTGRIRFDRNGDLQGGAISMFRVRNQEIGFVEVMR